MHFQLFIAEEEFLFRVETKVSELQPDPSILSVQASGFDLPVENVGGFFPSGLNASYVIVRLPDGLPSGDLLLTVTLHGMMSNVAIISISP